MRATYAAAGDFGRILADAKKTFRGALEGWGVLEDYDRMRAARAARHSAIAERPNTWSPEAFADPWAPPEPEWLERFRELDTQMMGGKS